MEYAYMFAACFVGGFFGAIVGNSRIKNTPVPIEKLIKAVTRQPSADPDRKLKYDKVHDRWLFKEVE